MRSCGCTSITVQPSFSKNAMPSARSTLWRPGRPSADTCPHCVLTTAGAWLGGRRISCCGRRGEVPCDPSTATRHIRADQQEKAAQNIHLCIEQQPFCFTKRRYISSRRRAVLPPELVAESIRGALMARLRHIVQVGSRDPVHERLRPRMGSISATTVPAGEPAGSRGARPMGMLRSMARVWCCPLVSGIVSCAVPVVCRLGGIRIVLRSREDDRHGPHFHAMAAERGASIRIGDEHAHASTLTGAELAVVVAWAARRRSELRRAWEQVQDGRPPGQIAP